MAFSGYYDFEGTVVIGIWARRSAGWQKVTNDSAYVNGGQYTSPAARSFSWFKDNVVYQLGTNVLAVGITIEGTTGQNASITNFTKLAWQAAGSASGVRSATPNGQKGTVTVKP